MDSKAQIAFRMNLNSLKRQDSAVVDIVARASHVVLYAHNEDAHLHGGEEWVKQDVEGTLFITKRGLETYSLCGFGSCRASAPYFGLVILNRLGTENHISYLSAVTSFQIHYENSFIVYRISDKYIFGLWFLDSNEHQQISQIFQSYCSSSSTSTPTSSIQSQYGGGGGTFGSTAENLAVKDVENAIRKMLFIQTPAAVASNTVNHGLPKSSAPSPINIFHKFTTHEASSSTHLDNDYQVVQEPTLKQMENALKQLLIEGKESEQQTPIMQRKMSAPKQASLLNLLTGLSSSQNSPVIEKKHYAGAYSESESGMSESAPATTSSTRRQQLLLPKSLLVDKSAISSSLSQQRPSSVMSIKPAFSDIPSQVMRANVSHPKPPPQPIPLSLSDFIQKYVSLVLQDSSFQRQLYDEYLSQFS